ncbi:unnamed protein product [Cylindrotheca closterium]|uniref:AAA+ ATPase domain-containing protein n=1 Tax=Cylindrotheca closterium TaxID=2856 RepID=A0AAD2FQL5_9STRA|nr:unnamed protein product [Cylindrotheca closterium]
MAKKKKKGRASTGGGNDVKKNIFPKEEESAPSPVVDFLSLQLHSSTSSLKKSMKYSPTLFLNQVDADSLDLINGDEVFILSDATSSEDVYASLAKVQIYDSSEKLNSPVKSPVSSKKGRLSPGSCHIHPVTLANDVLGIQASSKSNEADIPPTPKTPVPTTPVPVPTPSSSKSKFSFSKGGGGDQLISTPSKATTPTPNNTNKTARAPPRNIWAVVRQSDLGDYVASLLCCKASIITVEEVDKDSNKFETCMERLVQQLILAQLSGSYILKRGVPFRLSLRGLSVECKVTNVKGTSVPSVDNVLEDLSKLAIEGSTTDTKGENEVVEFLKSLDEEEVDLLRLYLISHQTTVKLGCSEQKDESKESKEREPLVAGLDKTVEEVKNILTTSLMHPELFSDLLRPPKGVLLHGASGTGKSSLALQVAQSLESHFHVEHISCASLQSQTALVGQAEKQLVQMFDNAQRPRDGKSGSLVVLDDVHLICPRREGTNLGADRLSATLLALLDGVKTYSSTYPSMVLATTSNPSLLDPALRRSGRLDSEIEVPLPDEPEIRSKILQFHIQSIGVKAPTLSETDWLHLGRIAKGFTGADLMLAVKEALRITVLRDIESVDQNNLEVVKVDLERGVRATKPSAIKAVTVEIPQVFWSSIGGMDKVKQELKEAIELPMTHGHLFKKLGINPPRGVLLYGPPGCSKTLMARALATEGNMNFLAVKGPELLSKWLGESERALAALFRRARLASPSVIFFDEVDAIATKRDGGSSGGERLLSQLLTELDGIHSKQDDSQKRRVVIVCATNRPDLLDDALMRPGRMDRLIYVGLPDEASRSRILHISLKGKSCDDDIDIEQLADSKISGGLSGAEIVAACRNAALIALEENEKQGDLSLKPKITMRHLVETLESMDRQISPEMLEFYQSFQGK